MAVEMAAPNPKTLTRIGCCEHYSCCQQTYAVNVQHMSVVLVGSEIPNLPCLFFGLGHGGVAHTSLAHAGQHWKGAG